MDSDFWNNLTQFGAAAMAAGGRPGATMLGALGEGGLAATDYARQQQMLHAQTALLGAESRGKNIQSNMMINQENFRRQLYGLPPLSSDQYGNVIDPMMPGGGYTNSFSQNGSGSSGPSVGSGNAAGMQQSPSAGSNAGTPSSAPSNYGQSFRVASNNGGMGLTANGAPPQMMSAPAPQSNQSGGMPGFISPQRIQHIMAGGDMPTPEEARSLAGLLAYTGDKEGAARLYDFGYKRAINEQGALGDYSKPEYNIPLQRALAIAREQAKYAGPEANVNLQTRIALGKAGFQSGPGGVAPISGGPADPAYLSQKADTEWKDLRGPGATGYQPSTGRTFQVPNQVKTVDPVTGQQKEQFVPLGVETSGPGGQGAPGQRPMPNNPPSVFNQGGAGPQQPGFVERPGVNSFVTGLGPGQHAQLEERGKQLGEESTEIDKAAQAALRNNTLFDEMRLESNSWRMGKFADFESTARQYGQAFAAQFGINATGWDKPVADYQAFEKNAMQLTTQATRETSSRAAVQEMKMIQEALPRGEMSRAGFLQIADQWQGMGDFALTKQRAKEQWRQSHGGDLEGFDVDFNSKVTPMPFILNRFAQSPEGQQNLAYMRDNLNKTPEGQKVLQQLLRETQFVHQQGYFGQ